MARATGRADGLLLDDPIQVGATRSVGLPLAAAHLLVLSESR